MRDVLFRLIGILEIAGGLYGLTAMLRRLLPLGTTQDAVFAIIGLLIFSFVLVAGVLLVENRPRGVICSQIAQLLQLPLLATPMFSYALHCGGYVNIYATLLHAPRLGYDWHLGSQGFVFAIAGPAVSRIGINLLALASWLALRLR
ncbi:hypothetical protein [Frateuria aurantia]|uniref:Uncharacterized protein n=1 Tax=Frateuria aurantia (strain ATCC 33424 / DSM 6220 / KCTC 2777 / LMG 1558 / NBRC 3245 / NCIMB 13370) TaxID=767434 RepID=H8L3W0_FRAAD|nr:hypothetical protein [Frateuria aurantia]AFC84915.1 hypothetical protein Fraau_0428 [Frateuria aurantia DSM 6220]